MSFKIYYMGHEFDFTEDYLSHLKFKHILYICKKCKIRCFLSEHDNYVTWYKIKYVTPEIILNITCNDMIIKNIIE
jgi:hypothetical protein